MSTSSKVRLSATVCPRQTIQPMIEPCTVSTFMSLENSAVACELLAALYFSKFLEGHPGNVSPPQYRSLMHRTDVWRCMLQSGTQDGKYWRFVGCWQAQRTSNEPVWVTMDLTKALKMS